MPEDKRAQNTSTINVRKMALDILISVMEEGTFCDKALHRVLEQNTMEKRDRSFLTRIVEGTVERCIELDYIINQFSKIQVKKMKPVIRNILRMSVYQIFYMEQVPDSAACNEAVKLVVKRKLHNLKGFVNGVLRNIIRQKNAIVYPEKKEIVDYLSIHYSMPKWIVTRWLKEYGAENTEKVLSFFLKEDKKLPIRCTLSRYPEKEIKDALESEKVLVSPGTLFPYAFRISNYSSLKELQSFRNGMFQVQDESSMTVGAVAGIKAGDTVIDVCAAPGGKTLHAADLLGKTGKVYSADLTEEKTKLIQQNCERLQYTNVNVTVNDAVVLKEEWIEKADVLIADLPCSGLGVIGKKCDIKYKTKEEDIESLAKIQRQILKTVVSYLKPKGKLIFSTCTIAEEENIKNVKWIEENLPLKRISIEERLPEKLKNKTGNQGYIQILPYMAETDGFFISLFEKKE